MLLEDLEHQNLHLVISGLTLDSPLKSRVGMTGAYVQADSEKHTIAVPPGENNLLFHLEKILNQHEVFVKKLLIKYSNNKE